MTEGGVKAEVQLFVLPYLDSLERVSQPALGLS
jgi:hypothetical protein